jgi:hypothetical protein
MRRRPGIAGRGSFHDARAVAGEPGACDSGRAACGDHTGCDLGDRINNAPTLKAAHIGLSVSGATGVAQAAADMILLASDLEVVADGVEEGRRTFANIPQVCAHGRKFELRQHAVDDGGVAVPALPSHASHPNPAQQPPVQHLRGRHSVRLVRPQAVARPQVWDMRALIRFAAVIGPLSSAFDLLTFGGLIALFHASPPEFRTAWFLASSATTIVSRGRSASRLALFWPGPGVISAQNSLSCSPAPGSGSRLARRAWYAISAPLEHLDAQSRGLRPNCQNGRSLLQIARLLSAAIGHQQILKYPTALQSTPQHSPSFPLDGPQRLRRHIIDHPVDPPHLVDNARRDAAEEFGRESRSITT